MSTDLFGEVPPPAHGKHYCEPRGYSVSDDVIDRAAAMLHESAIFKRPDAAIDALASLAPWPADTHGDHIHDKPNSLGPKLLV